MRSPLAKELKDDLEVDFKSLNESLPLSFLILDPNFKIISISNCFCSLVNMDRQMIVGVNLFSFFQISLHIIEDATIGQFKLSLNKVKTELCDDYMDIQKFSIKIDFDSIKTNTIKYWKISNHPILNKNNELSCIIIKVDDVTDSMKLKLMNLNENKYFLRTRYQSDVKEKIQRSQRLESIGQLSVGISHDISNLLTIINLNCDIILNSSQNITPIVKKQTSQIKKTSKHAAKVLQQILFFAKKQSVNLVSLNINIIIDDIEKMLVRLLIENIEFHKDLSPEINNILVDQTNIEQVILNLVINARDAIADVGTIKIATVNKTVEHDITLGSHFIRAGNYVVLSVIDSGVGMDPNTQARIFEPFFSTKEEGKGTGLGLATIYSIVEQNKGTIVVNSELGKGTSFHIYFPTTELSLSSVSLDNHDSDYLMGKENILVVEDNDELRNIISDCLTSYGYVVHAVKNGFEALEILKTKGADINLVVTDIIMSKISGKRLSEFLLEKYPDVKVIFISGHSEDILSLNGFSENDALLIKKPFVLSQLLSKIKELL